MDGADKQEAQQEVIDKLSTLGNELNEDAFVESRQIDDELMDTQALAMIYWGLSKLNPNRKLKFHKQTELFLQDTITKLKYNPKEVKLAQPIEVYDQMIQACGVILYSQSYLSNTAPSFKVYELINEVI